jgi:signal transduction histidine kinase
LQELSRKSIDALESDRRRVSKELHDGIGGSLAAIKFSLENLKIACGVDPAATPKSLKTIIAHMLETIKETKRISANLRPLMLDELGLLATIGWYSEQLCELYSGLKILNRIDVEEKDIPEPLKIILYRVTQEALTNAAKHSGADTIWIRLRTDGGFMALDVEDNGSGFDVQAVSQRSGFFSGQGLQGMQQRVEICGGTFSLRSEAGEGTVLRVQLPIFHQA